MKYNEIFDYIYADHSGIPERIGTLNAMDRLAWNILCEFRGRKGFDGWWCGIVPTGQDEIFDAVREIIRKAA